MVGHQDEKMLCRASAGLRYILDAGMRIHAGKNWQHHRCDKRLPVGVIWHRRTMVGYRGVILVDDHFHVEMWMRDLFDGILRLCHLDAS